MKYNVPCIDTYDLFINDEDDNGLDEGINFNNDIEIVEEIVKEVVIIKKQDDRFILFGWDE